MTASLISTVEGAIPSIVKALLSPSEIEFLAIDIDAVPRQVEAVIYTIAVHASALLEMVIADLNPVAATGAYNLSQRLDLLTTIKTELDAVLVPPAGSAVLKLLPTIIGQVQTYLQQSGMIPVATPTRALMAHIELLPLLAQQQAIIAKYVTPTANPDPNVPDTPVDLAAPPAPSEGSV